MTTLPSTLFIGDLSIFCTKEDIEREFSPFGPIVDIRIKRDENTNKNLSYGFVKFVLVNSAERAMHCLNGQVLCGRPMRISWASFKSKSDQNNRSEYGSIYPLGTMSGSTPTKTSVHVAFTTLVAGIMVTEAVIRGIFTPYGDIADVTIKKAVIINTASTKGFGFVHFADTEKGMRCAVTSARALANFIFADVSYQCTLSRETEALLKHSNLKISPDEYTMFRRSEMKVNMQAALSLSQRENVVFYDSQHHQQQLQHVSAPRADIKYSPTSNVLHSNNNWNDVSADLSSQNINQPPYPTTMVLEHNGRHQAQSSYQHPAIAHTSTPLSAASQQQNGYHKQHHPHQQATIVDNQQQQNSLMHYGQIPSGQPQSVQSVHHQEILPVYQLHQQQQQQQGMIPVYQNNFLPVPPAYYSSPNVQSPHVFPVSSQYLQPQQHQHLHQQRHPQINNNVNGNVQQHLLARYGQEQHGQGAYASQQQVSVSPHQHHLQIMSPSLLSQHGHGLGGESQTTAATAYYYAAATASSNKRGNVVWDGSTSSYYAAAGYPQSSTPLSYMEQLPVSPYSTTTSSSSTYSQQHSARIAPATESSPIPLSFAYQQPSSTLHEEQQHYGRDPINKNQHQSVSQEVNVHDYFPNATHLSVPPPHQSRILHANWHYKGVQAAKK